MTPRNPHNIHYWSPIDEKSEQAVEQDIYSLISLVSGVAAMLLKNRYMAWLALAATLAVAANQKTKDRDLKQSLGSMVFAIMVLVLQYVQVGPNPL